MSIRVQNDATGDVLEFDDGTSPSVIKQAMAKFNQDRINASINNPALKPSAIPNVEQKPLLNSAIDLYKKIETPVVGAVTAPVKSAASLLGIPGAVHQFQKESAGKPLQDQVVPALKAAAIPALNAAMFLPLAQDAAIPLRAALGVGKVAKVAIPVAKAAIAATQLAGVNAALGTVQGEPVSAIEESATLGGLLGGTAELLPPVIGAGFNALKSTMKNAGLPALLSEKAQGFLNRLETLVSQKKEANLENKTNIALVPDQVAREQVKTMVSPSAYAPQENALAQYGTRADAERENLINDMQDAAKTITPIINKAGLVLSNQYKKLLDSSVGDTPVDVIQPILDFVQEAAKNAPTTAQTVKNNVVSILSDLKAGMDSTRQKYVDAIINGIGGEQNVGPGIVPAPNITMPLRDAHFLKQYFSESANNLLQESGDATKRGFGIMLGSLAGKFRDAVDASVGGEYSELGKKWQDYQQAKGFMANKFGVVPSGFKGNVAEPDVRAKILSGIKDSLVEGTQGAQDAVDRGIAAWQGHIGALEKQADVLRANGLGSEADNVNATMDNLQSQWDASNKIMEHKASLWKQLAPEGVLKRDFDVFMSQASAKSLKYSKLVTAGKPNAQNLIALGITGGAIASVVPSLAPLVAVASAMYGFHKYHEIGASIAYKALSAAEKILSKLNINPNTKQVGIALLNKLSNQRESLDQQDNNAPIIPVSQQ